jgi:predicted PurR-regulated permease PerM
MQEPQPDSRSANPPAAPKKMALFYLFGALFLLAVVLLWLAGNVLLLIFAAVLLAVLLHGIASRLRRWFGMPRGVAIGLVLLLVVVAAGLFGLLLPRVFDQASQLTAEVPRSLRDLADTLRRFPHAAALVDRLPDPQQLFTRVHLLARAESVFSGVLGALANVVIVLFIALYLALRPKVYIDGVLKLLPPRKRQRGHEVFHELGQTLQLWLLGKLVSMSLIGIATGVGLMLLGVPLALVLGVVAGLLDFIPYIGPLIAALPALLIAFTQQPVLALYVALLFFGLQFVEGYLLLPLVERHTVSMPPALTIVMQVLLGLCFGLMGVALATPLTAVMAVLIAMLYVQDVLGDNVALPGKQQ